MDDATLRRPYLSRLKRLLVWRGCNGICGICGELVAFEACEIHHVPPFKMTGRTLLPELRPTHPICNRKQGAKYVEAV